MTGPLALLGILLLLVAIPLGLMIAPLVLGVILVVVAYRRFDRAVGAADPGVRMIGLAVFGLIVLVAPAVIVLGGLALAGLVVASLSGVDDARARGVRAALISPLPDPA